LGQAGFVKLRFTKRGVRQIEEIIDAIAQESPQGARRVRERMQSITTLLIEHPHIGQQTDVAGIRRMLVSPYPYLVFYRVAEDAVIIQRVRHAARNPSGAPRRA
jgi:toxin ParE1/3/4